MLISWNCPFGRLIKRTWKQFVARFNGAPHTCFAPRAPQHFIIHIYVALLQRPLTLVCIRIYAALTFSSCRSLPLIITRSLQHMYAYIKFHFHCFCSSSRRPWNRFRVYLYLPFALHDDNDLRESKMHSCFCNDDAPIASLCCCWEEEFRYTMRCLEQSGRRWLLFWHGFLK